MHTLCYACLYEWIASGKRFCSFCGTRMLEPPIRDNALEIELLDAIEIGLVIKSDAQNGEKVTGKVKDYIWEGFEFGDDEQDS
jgi:hypothetical protein